MHRSKLCIHSVEMMFSNFDIGLQTLDIAKNNIHVDQHHCLKSHESQCTDLINVIMVYLISLATQENKYMLSLFTKKIPRLKFVLCTLKCIQIRALLTIKIYILSYSKFKKKLFVCLGFIVPIENFFSHLETSP